MSVTDYEEEDFHTAPSRKVFFRILQLIRPYTRRITGFLTAIILVAGLDAVFTYLSKNVIDQGISRQNPEAVVQLLSIYSALIILQAVGAFIFIYLTSTMGEQLRYDMRRMLFAHLQDLSLSYYSRTRVGWIMARVTSDTERVADLMTWFLLDLTWAVVSILSSFAFMVVINWRLTLVVLAVLPVLIWVAYEFRKRILGEFRKVRRMNSRIVGAYNENITGVRVIKGLGREPENKSDFSLLTAEMYQSAYRAAWLSAMFLPVVQMISALALGAVVWYGGSQTPAGDLTVGGIHAFVSYIAFMMWPVQDLARVFAETQHALASAERIFSLIDARPEITDRPDACDPGSLQGKIEFDHVSFHYAENDEPVIEDLSLSVEHGETIALVGPTGGGKTTIVNLLCRFYEPDKGFIRINGRDYREYSLHAIQSRIGVVLQTPHLFSGNIRENIRYGRLNASDEEIIAAASLSGAADFIQKQEKGYDSEVGEGGGLLSVGQKQLISLSRAVLANPEIFIMDEATSSVDTLTEALIQKGMEVLMKGRTSFVIAHRLSTIRNADRIVVIEGGRIAEIGSHTELLKRRGKYYALYTRQFQQQMDINQHAGSI